MAKRKTTPGLVAQLRQMEAEMSRDLAIGVALTLMAFLRSEEFDRAAAADSLELLVEQIQATQGQIESILDGWTPEVSPPSPKE